MKQYKARDGHFIAGGEVVNINAMGRMVRGKSERPGLVLGEDATNLLPQRRNKPPAKPRSLEGYGARLGRWQGK